MAELKLFFVVGAQKTGTTALFDFCCASPNFIQPKLKEPHLLNSESNISLDEYIRIIGVSSGVTGDFSPSYLYSPIAPRNIQRLFPTSPIVIILRNPMERALSNMVHNVRIGREPRLDLDALMYGEEDRLKKNNSYHYLTKSLYFQQVKRYIDTFGRDQILILHHEDMKGNTKQFLQQFSDFVGLMRQESYVLSNRNTGHVGKNQLVQNLLSSYSKHVGFSGRFNSWIPKWVKKSLKNNIMQKPELPSQEWIREGNQKYFMRDIKQLEQLLNMSFANWYEAPPTI